MPNIQQKLVQQVFTPIEKQNEVSKEEKTVPKPRLGFYRALLSYAEPDLERIIEAFIYCARRWLRQPNVETMYIQLN